MHPPRHLAKLSIWRGGLGIFDIDPQLNYIIRMHLKVIKSQQCSVERSHVVLKLILNSDQGLALFRQTRCLHARQPGAISPKPLCLAVVMRMREIFLLQNKCRVAKLCKNRCPAVDLTTFYRKISAGQIRFVKIDTWQWT